MRKGWKLKKLGDLFDITSSKRVFEADWTKSGVPFYRAREIVRLARNGAVENELFISEEMYNLYAEKYGIPQPGDIMVTGVGTLGITYCVKKGDRFYFKDGNIIWLKKKTDVDSRYIEYAFQSQQIKKQVADNVGATVGTYTIIRAKNTEVLLPPINEQKQIVEILDKAFADLEIFRANAEANLKNAIELFEIYLNHIFVNTNPDWKSGKFREICGTVYTGPFGSLLHKSDYIQNGIPLVNPSQIINSKIVPNNSKSISENSKARLSSYVLSEGDLVIGRRGEIGRVAVVGKYQDGWVCGTGSFYIRLFKNVSPHFAAYLLRSERYRNELISLAQGATMLNLSNTALSNIEVSIPDFATQNILLKRIESLGNFVSQIEEYYRIKLRLVDELKQSILAKAFSGELLKDDNVIHLNISANSNTKAPEFTANIIAYAHLRHKMKQREKTFGHVKAQKTLQLIEAIGGIDLGRNPQKDAAGPNDFGHMLRAEVTARANQFFEFVQQGAGYDFAERLKYNQLITEARKSIEPFKSQIDKVLEIIIPMDSRQAEVFATVHAAWNNLLLDGKHPTNEEIIFEARENWHDDKLKIPKSEFEAAIKHIKSHGVEPKGEGKRVIGQERLI